jgi:S1-C subfamily serine protease
LRWITPDLAKAMDLKSDQRGALVITVTPGGPADKAGLQGSDRQVTIDGQNINVGGDVITAIDGKEITDIYDYMNRLKRLQPGQVISVDVLRDGKTVVLIIQL